MPNPGVEPKQEKTDWCKETPPRASDTPIIYTLNSSTKNKR